jgi:hypothetical protein
MNDLAILLGYEATQDLELRKTETVSSMIKTPMVFPWDEQVPFRY